MSRKRTKRKQHSCKTCKPGRTGLANRWTAKDEALLRAFERDLQRGGCEEVVSHAVLVITQSGLGTSLSWWRHMHVDGDSLVLLATT